MTFWLLNFAQESGLSVGCSTKTSIIREIVCHVQRMCRLILCTQQTTELFGWATTVALEKQLLTHKSVHSLLTQFPRKKKDREKKKFNKIHQLSLKVIKPNWKKKIPAKKCSFHIHCQSYSSLLQGYNQWGVYSLKTYIQGRKKNIPVLYLIGEHEIQTVGKMPTWRCFQKVELN